MRLFCDWAFDLDQLKAVVRAYFFRWSWNPGCMNGKGWEGKGKEGEGNLTTVSVLWNLMGCSTYRGKEDWYMLCHFGNQPNKTIVH